MGCLRGGPCGLWGRGARGIRRSPFRRYPAGGIGRSPEAGNLTRVESYPEAGHPRYKGSLLGSVPLRPYNSMAFLPPPPIRIVPAPAPAPLLATGRSQSANGAEDGARERPAMPIDTEEVRREAVNRTVNVTGTLAAENQVTVSSQAEGVVSRILADLGDRVSANQILVELDREKLQYNLD